MGNEIQIEQIVTIAKHPSLPGILVVLNFAEEVFGCMFA